MPEKGLIELYCGGGKGKTTAAVGLCIRAKGNGLKVLFVQFLKGRPTGEIEPLKKFGIDVIRSDEVTKFIPNMTKEEFEICCKAQKRCFNEAVKQQMNYDLIVLDELNGAVSTDTLDLNEVLDFLKNKPKCLEIVITGRDPAKEFFELADYISEIKAVRHPFDKGITARKGIEF